MHTGAPWGACFWTICTSYPLTWTVRSWPGAAAATWNVASWPSNTQSKRTVSSLKRTICPLSFCGKLRNRLTAGFFWPFPGVVLAAPFLKLTVSRLQNLLLALLQGGPIAGSCLPPRADRLRRREDPRVQLPDWRLLEGDHGRGRICRNPLGAFPRQRVRQPLSWLKFFCQWSKNPASPAPSSILVNSKSRINRFQFAKVFWDYEAGSPTEVVKKPTSSPGDAPDHPNNLATRCKKKDEKNVKKSDKSKLCCQSNVLPSSAKHPLQGKNAVTEICFIHQLFIFRPNFFIDGGSGSVPLTEMPSNEPIKRLPHLLNTWLRPPQRSASSCRRAAWVTSKPTRSTRTEASWGWCGADSATTLAAGSETAHLQETSPGGQIGVTLPPGFGSECRRSSLLKESNVRKMQNSAKMCPRREDVLVRANLEASEEFSLCLVFYQNATRWQCFTT